MPDYKPLVDAILNTDSPEQLAQAYIESITDWPDCSTRDMLLGMASDEHIAENFRNWYGIYTNECRDHCFPLIEDTLPVVLTMYHSFKPRPELISTNSYAHRQD